VTKQSDTIINELKEQLSSKDQIILEILDNYLEFIDIVRALKPETMLKKITNKRKRDWQPILEEYRKGIENDEYLPSKGTK
jgi:hypothetical protein